jgi:hypothetical protein
MNRFIEKIFGIDKIKAKTEEAVKQAEASMKVAKEAAEAAERATEAEAQAKLTPKERATAKGEPWVAVLDTHVNKDNVKNGFFELDWNDHFIVQLKQAGYGFDGDPDEQIVDRWFRDLAGNMLAEAGQDVSRVGGGFIDVTKLPGGKAEIK